MIHTDKHFSCDGRSPYQHVRSRTSKFFPFSGKFLSSALAAFRTSTLSSFRTSALAVFIFFVSLGLLSTGCSREDNPSVKTGKKGAITFTATSGNPSAATKSSADAFSSGASLSVGTYSPSASGISAFSDAGTSVLSSSGGNSFEEGQTYKIYYDFEKGENVEAPASVNGSSYDADGNLMQSSDTRFSGEVFSVSTSSTGYSERLDWVAGDKITIFECQNGEYANYTIKDVTSASKPERSKASLFPTSGNGLQWHDGYNHKFVALYPSIDDLGISSPTITYNSSSFSVSIQGEYSMFPNNQSCTKVDGGRTYKGPTTPTSGTPETWYEPNMKNAYMLSTVEVASSAVPLDNLSLAFYPQFSSVEVKLFKPDGYSSNTVKLVKAVLRGGNGTGETLSGSPILSREQQGSSTTTLNANRTISYSGHSTTNTINLSFKASDGITDDEPVLEKYSTTAKPVCFTFLTSPSNYIRQLELELTLSVDGILLTRKLSLKDGSGWIPLPAGKKLTITNMKTPAVDVTPLTIEPIEAGTTTITINNPNGLTYKYSINGGAKVEKIGNPIEIPANQGDKVALYQDGAVALGGTDYYNDPGLINFSNRCYVYGNVMSLASEKAYPNVKSTVQYQFVGLFRNNTNLLSDPARPLLLPAETLAEGCYAVMFYGCTGLESAPALPAETLAQGCYYGMFAICSGLTSAPALPAETLAAHCYYAMFQACENLKNAPALPATTLAESCYAAMFAMCIGLKDAPALPAETLAESCYLSMFFSCENLKDAPALPATTLANKCYYQMFIGCISLETAPPALPATTLAESCYSSMFFYCTGLKDAPALPATTLAANCYQNMFYYCTSLKDAPALPATTLAANCYQGMFYHCTSMEIAPKLPATTAAEGCYQKMFEFCDKLSYVECNLTDMSATDCIKDWLHDAGTDPSVTTRTFRKNASATWPTGNSGIPSRWTIENITP